MVSSKRRSVSLMRIQTEGMRLRGPLYLLGYSTESLVPLYLHQLISSVQGIKIMNLKPHQQLNCSSRQRPIVPFRLKRHRDISFDVP